MLGARSLGLLALAALACACSLEGFAGGGGAGGAAAAGGSAGGGAGGHGGGSSGGGGQGASGGCPACACGPWSEIQVSSGGPAIAPSLARAGSAWAIAWQDARDANQEIYFARVDDAGLLLGTELRVTNDPAESLAPALVWTGSEHAIAYEDTRTGNSAAYLSSVDAAGQALVLDLEVWKGSGAPKEAVVGWDGAGSRYVLAWDDFRDSGYKIHTGVVSAAGTVTATDQRITDAIGAATAPAIVRGSQAYGLTWQDSRDGNNEIYFVLIDDAGVKIGSELPLSQAAGDSLGPAVSYTGNGFGVAWSDARDGNAEIYLARLTQGGAKLGSEQRLTNDGASSSAVSIAWDGSAYALAWQDDRGGQSAIYFARVDAEGVFLGPEARIAGGSGAAERPSLAWSGQAFGVSWQEVRDGQTGIYFATCAP